jgi:hypothetical protein
LRNINGTINDSSFTLVDNMPTGIISIFKKSENNNSIISYT